MDVKINKFKFGKRETVTVKGKQFIADHFNQYKQLNDFTGKQSHIIELVTFSKRTGNIGKKIVLVSPNNDKNYSVIEKLFKV
jgi:hypothetical protein